jgi:hypothetical protein
LASCRPIETRSACWTVWNPLPARRAGWTARNMTA